MSDVEGPTALCTGHPPHGIVQLRCQQGVGGVWETIKECATVEPGEGLVVTQHCPQGSGAETAPDHWKGAP